LPRRLAAMPIPISHSPSRTDAGAGTAAAQACREASRP